MNFILEKLPKNQITSIFDALSIYKDRTRLSSILEFWEKSSCRNQVISVGGKITQNFGREVRSSPIVNFAHSSCIWKLVCWTQTFLRSNFEIEIFLDVEWRKRVTQFFNKNKVEIWHFQIVYLYQKLHFSSSASSQILIMTHNLVL